MIEQLILSNLSMNERYSRRVLPFLTTDYFSSKPTKVVFDLVSAFIDKYNELPTKKSLKLELAEVDKISQGDFSDAETTIDELSIEEGTDVDWLVDKTEQFCKDRALYNALMKSIEITDDKDGKTALSKGSIPGLLQEALSVSFDSSIGHDFFDDHLDRYNFYHTKEERVPFDIEYLNMITKGGLPRKSLNIALAGTGVGKSLFMCHCAAGNLTDGYNVLYITMEMAEEKIAERIDSNLLDVRLDELMSLTKAEYEAKVEKVKSKTTGKLIVKEYPTAGANTNHFRNLLNELKIKKNFVPDMIYIDYLNICSSSRMKAGAGANSYQYIKSIAEELRGLAVEYNVPIVSATQTTRSGFTSSDIGLEDTSESFGLPATADFMFAMIKTDELEEMNQIMFKQLKNRYNDPTKYKRFVVGVDRGKMRLYDADQLAQDDVMDTGPVFDKTPAGGGDFNSKFKDFM